MKLSVLSKRLDGAAAGPGDPEISGAAGLAEAAEGQITFVAGPQFLKDLPQSKASAALVPLDAPEQRMPVVRVRNPRLAFARALKIFYVKPYLATGVTSAPRSAKM